VAEQVGGRREDGEASVRRYVSEPDDRGLRDAKRHARARAVFVTGTGTEVGKTIVAAAIARTLAAEGTVAVFKPAVSGLDDYPPPLRPPTLVRDTSTSVEGLADHEVLRLSAGSDQSDDEIAPYRYGPPVSPHLAAALAGAPIEPERLLAAAAVAAERADSIVVEGVGGLLVPLTPTYLVRDFAVALGHPLVVVAPPGLGTINHTLLTVEAARAAGLAVAAVVLNPWPAEPGAIERSNRETIEALGEVPVLTLPHLDLAALDSWPRLELDL
jgi:dethiobiotin synthetase